MEVILLALGFAILALVAAGVGGLFALYVSRWE